MRINKAALLMRVGVTNAQRITKRDVGKLGQRRGEPVANVGEAPSGNLPPRRGRRGEPEWSVADGIKR